MDMSRLRPAERRRLEAVALCSRVASRRRRVRPDSFMRAAYADQLDRALETLHRAVGQAEREAEAPVRPRPDAT